MSNKTGEFKTIVFLFSFLWLVLSCIDCSHSEETLHSPASQNTAQLQSRCLYAPGHFGNSYEVMGQNEMLSILAEAQWWGYNRYGDWFDTIDCSDPFSDKHYNLAGALWERKKANFKTAQSLGLACDFIITPNHVYLNQCRPEIEAQKGNRIFGQLICPSIPEARKIILDNYRNLFADLAQEGVRLSALCACPYDYGGCSCKACDPWILTFAALCRDIHTIAEQYHPGIEMHFIGWWWTEDEHRLFADWVDDHAPGWAKSIALHIPYGESQVSDVALPRGCERRAFVHIGYAEEANPRDTYGHLGPVIAASRLEDTVNALKEQGCTGIMAYSEGVYDDANKALLGGLASGAYPDNKTLLRAYAKRYFNVKDTASKKWTSWLMKMGKPYDLDAEKALRKFDTLAPRDLMLEWRLRHWRLKAELLRLNTAILQEQEWTPSRFALVDEFWAVQEVLQRQVYGLGPLRHVLARRFTPLPWYKDWKKHIHEESTPREKE